MRREFLQENSESDNNSAGEDFDVECFENHEFTKEISTKKVTNRRNKNSIVSFNEIN